MRRITTALFLLSVLQAGRAVAAPAPQTGTVEAGKIVWEQKMCSFCHGHEGQGAFGPDLAGRKLTLAQFTRAVRQPWGIMPKFGDQQISDQNLADLHAFLSSEPPPAEFANWHWAPPPPGSPLGQRLQIVMGCGQCHEPELGVPRRSMGGMAKDVDFAYFAKLTYQHSDKYPRTSMGDFSPDRLSEPLLREIYKFIQDLGLRVPISSSMSAAPREGNNTTYTVTVSNTGTVGKGLDAEDVTITVLVPQGSKVVSATGTGYQGVRTDKAMTFASDGSGKVNSWDAEVACWQVPRVAPGDKQTYTLTLSGATAPPPMSFNGSLVRWAKPTTRTGVPNLVYRDHRIPEIGDAAAIRPPRPDGAP